jgi:hypothetical protein
MASLRDQFATQTPTEIERDNRQVGSMFEPSERPLERLTLPDYEEAPEKPSTYIPGEGMQAADSAMVHGAPGTAPSLRDVYGEAAGFAEPTTAEKAEQIGLGITEGGIRGTGVVGGALYGGRLGAGALAPFGPVPAAIGGTGGALIGGFLGYQGTNPIVDLFPAVPREDLVPYREGGITAGETLAAAPFAFGLPVSNANRVATFLSNMGQAARSDAKGWLTREALVLPVTVGTAGGVAVNYAPDNAAARFGAEFLTGMVSPTRTISEAWPRLKASVLALKGSFSQEARQQRAANRLVTLLSQETEEDIPTLIRKLEQLYPEGVDPTAAQKSGSEGLTILETTLARDNAKYAAETQQRGETSIRALRNLVKALSDTGDPNMLREAALLRQELFTGLLDRRLAIADERAAQAIAKIKVDTPESRAQIGSIVRGTTEDALADARAHEQALWRRAEASQVQRQPVEIGEMDRTSVFKNLKDLPTRPSIETTNMVNQYLDFVSGLTPERAAGLPAQVRSTMARMGLTDEAVDLYRMGRSTPEYLETGVVPLRYQFTDFKPTTAQDLVAIRGDMLELARNAQIAGNPRETNLFSRLAQGAYDDMEKNLVGPEYDDARAFSKALNDHFTRSYAGDMLSQSRRGERLPPELLVQRAFGSNADITALRMNQIEDAVGFMADAYDDAVRRFGADSEQAMMLQDFAANARNRATSIRDANRTILRGVASRAWTPDPNAPGGYKLNVGALRRMTDDPDTAQLLKHVGLYDDLVNVDRAETLLKNAQDFHSHMNKTIRNQAAFAQVLKYESATDAVTDALTSKNPAEQLTKIVKLARRGKAVDGLKSTLYDYAFTRAGGENRFSPKAFDAAIFEPIRPGLPSVYQILRKEGVMSISEAKNLRQLLAPMERVERAMGNRQLLEELLSGADAATELGLRVIGARAGTTLAGGQNGSSLIAAAAGSKYMRSIFDSTPTMMTRGIIEEATKDPKLMAMLLRRGEVQKGGIKPSLRERIRVNELTKYLTSLGFRPPTVAATINLAPDEEIEPIYSDVPYDPTKLQEMYERNLQIQQKRSQQILTPTRGLPITPGAGGAPAPTGQGSVGPQSSSRDMLQRLFPMDTMLG